ncbi:hypothetical protein GXW83_23405 [Streptacidiphilus sp. PB12-B1b]|uniref:hypothetical protein n=1 Tax=Streptacidiphilus sp. PB12-B1b TaxID=2705012 RepID=UPI0015F853BE|nr:hypothetical protein [Streptacidiphilus sp. PB12-B1b]QMU78209.1 hypothetical protein GXW83_23405 [Streptacidiphilus sp. PB12-B1b]
MARPSSTARLMVAAVLTGLLAFTAPAAVAVAETPQPNSSRTSPAAVEGHDVLSHCLPGHQCKDTSWGG